MQKEPGETIEETFGCVRLEWINKWPKYILDDDYDDDDDDDDGDSSASGYCRA